MNAQTKPISPRTEARRRNRLANQAAGIITAEQRQTVEYRSIAAPIKKRVHHRIREPRSAMRPVQPLIMPIREWSDTPEDRAEVARILNKSPEGAA